MKTKDRLAGVLQAEGLESLARQALAGFYDDFESPLVAPIHQLVSDLFKVGRNDLARRAMDGEWNGTSEDGMTSRNEVH